MQDNSLSPSFTSWDKYSDTRGDLFFNNQYVFDEVKRIYYIDHADVAIERGWRAHKIEQRWFIPMFGAFEIKVVKIDNFVNPNPNQEISVFEISQETPGTLHIPIGFATSLKALMPNSRVMLMADSYFEDAKMDNYLFPNEYFNNQK